MALGDDAQVTHFFELPRFLLDSVFGLGTWLRENKHFEYIPREEVAAAPPTPTPP